MIKNIDGDLLNCDAKYIAHQCNCISKSAGGLAFYLFKKYPYSNIYSCRDYNDSSTFDTLGTIKISGNGKDQRYIINMFSQYDPGSPNNDYSKLDGFKARENNFKKCLDEILKIKNLESIAFPKFIGCGLAGGNWEHYYKMLEEFSTKTLADVYIIKLT
jgi:O-acetyl-ADP-ribose deacetylase (regulator of RNase III)